MPLRNPLLKSQAIQQVSEHHHLGVITDDQLQWQAHVNCISNAVAKNVYLLSRLRHFSNVEACRAFFHAQIISRKNDVCKVWDSYRDVHMKKLISVHKRAVKHLRAASQMLPGRGHTSAEQQPLKQHLQHNKCILVHKVVRNKSPAYLKQLLHAGTRSSTNSRNSIFVLP